jgi:hypothetical protein
LLALGWLVDGVIFFLREDMLAAVG